MTFISSTRAAKTAWTVSNHLKWLANELPVTFLYAGVGLAGRGLFAEGLTGQNAALAQTGRRWTRLELPPFEIVSEQGRRDWQGLLKATERQLVLARARPGMLTGLADYLFERTSGHIGSFITLITRGCVTAIRSGQEDLTAALLDRVRIDEASEQARRQLAAAFTAGRLSATPAAGAADHGPPPHEPAGPDAAAAGPARPGRGHRQLAGGPGPPQPGHRRHADGGAGLAPPGQPRRPGGRHPGARCCAASSTRPGFRRAP